ncbi:hypothetical protein HanRHA438_Chr08g0369191 [Helianthus annuus]|nr:hypothetical protein HanRHA438_Chr08g0369191 [Helianthus annuus]
MIAASIYAVTVVIFRSTFARNDLLWFSRFLSSSHNFWNSISYPLSNYIFDILPSHILIFLILLRLVYFINWFIRVFHLLISIGMNY